MRAGGRTSCARPSSAVTRPALADWNARRASEREELLSREHPRRSTVVTRGEVRARTLAVPAGPHGRAASDVTHFEESEERKAERETARTR